MILTVVALGCAAGCSSAPPPPAIDRVALMKIDDLSGGGGAKWIGEVVWAIAGSQLAGVGNIVPLRVDTSADATAQHATHIVAGHFDLRGGQPHFTFSIEDTQTHKTREVTAEGTPLAVATTLAKAIDPNIRPFSSSNDAAIEAWGKKDFAKAVELDPDFGTAWIDWAQSQGQVQPGIGLDTANRALARTTLKTDFDRARLELLAGQLGQDRARMTKGAEQLSNLMPKDANLARAVGEMAANGRQFQQAIQYYQRATAVDPGMALAWNGLGYAQCLAGDVAAAQKAFEKYGSFEDQAANAADSEGECRFMRGQFKEAEALFQKAHQLKPELLQGGDLQKAAYAHWLGGDLAGADKIFADFLKYRKEKQDKVTDWRQGVWFYATGRAQQAVEALEKMQGEVAPLGQQQVAVWANTTQIDQPVAVLEPIYRNTPPNADGLVRTLLARALWKADREQEAAQMAELWPLPENGEPLLQGFQYPLYQELKKALAKPKEAK